MKNKKATYLLLFVVLIIWGFIVFRIYRTVNPSDEKKMNVSIGSILTDTRVTDTFSIAASYRDPFLNHYVAVSHSVRRSRPVPVQLPQLPKAPVRWPDVKFLGTISNNKLAKKIILVSINGRDNLMREGETVNDLSLLKIAKDSVQLSYMGEKKFFTKKSY
jgi:hypothetical protein